jgi:quercetin dioxygenase-like cupin family protein
LTNWIRFVSPLTKSRCHWIRYGKAQALAAGGFFAFPPGMAHFVSVDEDTVVHLSSMGPWDVTYVNPKDDPRQKSQ